MIQKILFESPIWLGGISFLLFAAVLFARRRLESDGARAWALPGVLLLTAGLFVLQWAVTTDREAILARMDTLAVAVAAKDRHAIADIFDASYDSENMDHKELVAFMDDILKRVDVYDARFLGRDLKIDGTRAMLRLRAMATVKIAGGVGKTHIGDWEIHWTNGSDGWSITKLRPMMIDNVPIESLGALRGYVP